MAINPQMEYFDEFRDLYCDGSAEQFILAALVDAGYSDRMEYAPEDPTFVETMIRDGGDVSEFYFKHWAELHEEIWDNISTHVGDKPFLKRYICSMIQAFKEVSSYYYPGKDATDNEKEIADYLSALKNYNLPRSNELHSIADPVIAELKASPDFASTPREEREKKFVPLFEDAVKQYKDHLNLNIYKVSRLVASMMEELAVHITACLFEAGEESTVFYYQGMCGVVLTDVIYPFYLCRTMDWTKEYAESYMPGPLFYYPDSPLAKCYSNPVLTNHSKNGNNSDKTINDYIVNCREFICSEDVLDFLDVVCLSLGMKPKRFKGEVSKEDYADFIDAHIRTRVNYIYPHAASLEAQLAAEIKSRKDDDLDLTNYIVGFLSPFYEVSISLFPLGKKLVDVERRVLFKSASAFICCPFKDFMPILTDAITSVVSRETKSDYVSTADLMNALLERAPRQGTVPKDRVFAAIHEIKKTLALIEAALESALLKAGISNDYIYYENEAGVNLGHQVSEFELMEVSGLTPHTIAARIKKYGHSTDTYIRDGEDTYDFIRRYYGIDPEHENDGTKYVVVYAPEDDTHGQSLGDTPAPDRQQQQTFPPDRVGDMILSDTMKSYLNKAGAYFSNGHWWNDNKRHYAIFLKVLYCKVFNKNWDNNVRWVDLPILPLRSGTLLTIPQLKGALRNYDAAADGGVRQTFENLLGCS